MIHWRMQLHPDNSNLSVKHTTESLSAGFIGLGFGKDTDPGDLTKVKPTDSGVILQNNEEVYWQFADEMQIGDIVAIFCHNQPFALTKVTGDYNFIKSPVREIGVWFNHFRTIDKGYTKFFLDLNGTTRNQLEELIKGLPSQMTIQKHIDNTVKVYQFIDKWANLP